MDNRNSVESPSFMSAAITCGRTAFRIFSVFFAIAGIVAFLIYALPSAFAVLLEFITGGGKNVWRNTLLPVLPIWLYIWSSCMFVKMEGRVAIRKALAVVYLASLTLHALCIYGFMKIIRIETAEVSPIFGKSLMASEMQYGFISVCFVLGSVFFMGAVSFAIMVGAELVNEPEEKKRAQGDKP